ncbi:MAG: thioredoxin-disulfide reductase [Fimbriiglobus sp.]
MAEKVVIIGSGPAAWTAAIYASRAQLDPLVFQGNPFDNKNKQNGTMPLGQLALTTEVENFPSWPAGDTRAYLKTALQADDVDFPYWVSNEDPQPTHGINGPELMALMRQQAKNFGTRIESKDVVKVDLKSRPFKLFMHDGSEVETLTLIIATGARANYLGLPSEEKYKNKGVSACAVCDGFLPMFRNKPLAVVGAGDSACEEATYLTKFASKVYMIVRRDQMRASKIMAERAKNHPKIEVVWNSVVEEVLGNEKTVTGLRVKSTTGAPERTLDVAGMFCAIGHTPNVNFLDGQVQTNEAGYIVWTTVSRTYTSVDGVFAAGDVSDDYYRQAISAAGTGCMAALDAERWLGHHGHL